jgi:histidinol dehydrogenase
MELIDFPERDSWKEILRRPVLNTESLFATVRTIIDRVRTEGDSAVLELESKFDKVELATIAVSEEEFAEAEGLLDAELKDSIRAAAKNIDGSSPNP